MIDKGSIGVAVSMELTRIVDLGVASMLPVGLKGWRLLRGMIEGDGACNVGSDNRLMASSARSSSIDGRSTRGGTGLLGGKDDGLRGPINRRSVEA